MDKVYMAAGFLFNNDKTRVALVLKSRPKWMAGNYNAIGGKVEPGETSLEAMTREFREETGLAVEGWNHFSRRSGDTWSVDFYWAVNDLDAMESQIVPEGDEPVSVFELNSLPDNIIDNVPGLMSYALSQSICPELYPFFEVVENEGVLVGEIKND